MKYFKKIRLKDGRECILRNCEETDGQAVLSNFILAHILYILYIMPFCSNKALQSMSYMYTLMVNINLINNKI